MATVVNFVSAATVGSQPATHKGVLPVADGRSGVVETLTDGSTSVATTAATPYAVGYAVVHAGANAITVIAGATPVATATTGTYIPANQHREIALLPGDKIAIIQV